MKFVEHSSDSFFGFFLMPVATRTRLSSFLLPCLLVLAGLASSCQSSRPGFAFQAAPRRAPQAEVVAQEAVVPGAAAATFAAAPAVPARPVVARRQPKPRRPLVPARLVAATKALVTPKVGHSRLQQRRAMLQRRQATAEAGLGTTVLGVLGLIVLPIAALGLILSGGALGWIIVGGLAALAVLVAWLDPFGR